MNKSGAALMITLWITTILSIVAFSAAYFSRTDLKMAEYQAKSLQAYALARGGVELAIAKLLIDFRQSPEYDAYDEGWVIDDEDLEALEIDPAQLEVNITDEAAKINLNMDNFYNLFSFLQFLPRWSDCGEINVLLDSLKDWRDEDMLEELNGAEDSYYLSLSPPYPCKDGKFDIPEEILLVRGMKPDLFFENYFTVFGDEKLNINTVSKDVLYAMLEGQNIPGAETTAAAIIAYRPFTSTTNPLIPAEIQDILKVSSSRFKISSAVSFENFPVRKKLEVILDRTDSPVKILYWRES